MPHVAYPPHVSLQQIAGLIKGVFETPSSPNKALLPGGLALGGVIFRFHDMRWILCSGQSTYNSRAKEPQNPQNHRVDKIHPLEDLEGTYHELCRRGENTRYISK